MSYYWAIPGPVPAPTCYSVMGGQSSLHQERTYLLSALAAEESREEQLTFSLNATKEKLAAAEHEDSTEAVKSLKKAVAGLTRKRKRSQKSQKAMINNLAAVTSRMQILEQYQWRRAQFEYNQRCQFPFLNDINMNMQNLTLISPIRQSHQYQCQSPIGPPTPGLAHPVPPRPMLNAQWTTNHADGWASPLYTRSYAQPDERLEAANQAQQQIKQYPPPNPEASWRNVEYASRPGQASGSRCLRTMSLPLTRHGASPVRKGSWMDREDDISPKSGMNLARRLSLVGGASSGLRLEKLIN
jgi:hypothetical protein